MWGMWELSYYFQIFSVNLKLLENEKLIQSSVSWSWQMSPWKQNHLQLRTIVVEYLGSIPTSTTF